MSDIQFIKRKNISFAISALLIIVSLYSFITKGLNYGIDFTGGTLLHYQFENEFENEKINEVLEKSGIDGSIQRVTDGKNEIIITTTFLDTERKKEFRDILRREVGNLTEDGIKRETDIGPTVGRELKENATKAVLWSIIAILIYISARFDFKFAAAAIIALIHDSIITIGIFSILAKEINNTMIAALLTLLGYSLNDTIVVCDRIRENTKKFKNSDFDEMVNTSINQSLSRTIHTSLTTLIPVLTLFFFGGEILRNFALALLIGVLVGTYSSIFIASPIITIWNKGKVR
ncbi:MAG: protein translocase subunit SecF [Candidatus Muirbacterium halophilum]|nr:protein translocase subunit SecF [Candidatus Muirbacterium halophilum]